MLANCPLNHAIHMETLRSTVGSRVFRQHAEASFSALEGQLKSATMSFEELKVRCDELYQQRVHALLAPLPGTLLEHKLRWELLQTPLPPRCSHQATVLSVNGSQVMVLMGGMADQQWHTSTLVVTGLDLAVPSELAAEADLRQEVEVHVAQANGTAALQLAEFSACAVSDACALVCGGMAERDGSGRMELWLGALSIANGAFPLL